MMHLSFATHTTSEVPVNMCHGLPSSSVATEIWRSTEEAYADIFKAQIDASAEFAKMMSSAQQALDRPFAQKF